MLRDNRENGGDRRPTAYNVLGEALEMCSMKPMTGFYRDGCCNTGREDIGSHTVCVVVTAAFLDFSKSCGNDLSTPVPEFGFQGLKPGDRWCLCAPRWQEALKQTKRPASFCAPLMRVPCPLLARRPQTTSSRFGVTRTGLADIEYAARSIGVSSHFCAKSITPDGGHLIFAVSRMELIAMSEKENAKSETQILRDAFEGMKGRQPRSDQELKEWLATDEGKEATMFESTSLSRFGEIGRA